MYFIKCKKQCNISMIYQTLPDLLSTYRLWSLVKNQAQSRDGEETGLAEELRLKTTATQHFRRQLPQYLTKKTTDI